MRRINPIFSVLIHSFFLVFILSCGSFVRHQVKSGETLYSIGWKYAVDYKTLAEWNDIPPPYMIHEGQWLRVVSPLPETDQEKIPLEASSQLNDIQRIKKKIVKHKTPASNTVARVPKKQTATIKEEVSPIKEESSGITWVWPTDGELIKTFSKEGHGKKGVDISGKRGQKIVASAAGLVVYSGSGIIGLGNLVIIKHNKTFLSAYAHNEQLLVKEGEEVKQGQQIANMGDSGTERVLLHFEIRKNGKPVNPMRYLAEK